MTRDARRRTALAAFAAAALFASGCTTTAGSPEPPTGSPRRQTSGDPPATAPSPSDFVPSIAPGATYDTDEVLAARFPTSIAGSAVEVQTIGATTYLEFLGQDDPARRADFEALIAALGVDAEAVSVGGGGFTYGGTGFVLEAIRVAGADGPGLLATLVSDIQQDSDDPSAVESTTATVGGRPVTIVTVPGATTTYLHSARDVVWSFDTDDPAVADVVFRAIP